MKSSVPTAAKQPKQLVSSVLHWLVNQYPAYTFLRHEKDALLLDRQMHTQERGSEKRDVIAGAPEGVAV